MTTVNQKPTENSLLDVDINSGRAELVVVGTGYRVIGDITLQAQGYIRAADIVLYGVANRLCAEYIQQLNPSAESLLGYYAPGKNRRQTYAEVANRILDEVRKGQAVCAVFYGHPGVFVNPSHVAVQRAREEGFPARMLPAASAEDWIFADLGIDPCRSGSQSFEATDFLLHSRIFDPTSLLILWQVGAIGVTDAPVRYEARDGAQVLVESLLGTYDAEHEVVVYEASPYAAREPRIERCPLATLPKTVLTSRSTLVIPPKKERPADRDMLARLGLL